MKKSTRDTRDMYIRDIRRFSKKIKVGKKYTLPRSWIREHDVPFLKIMCGDFDMRCVEKCRDFAVFETSMGIKTSFTYLELMTLINKGAIIYEYHTGEPKEVKLASLVS